MEGGSFFSHFFSFFFLGIFSSSSFSGPPPLFVSDTELSFPPVHCDEVGRRRRGKKKKAPREEEGKGKGGEDNPPERKRESSSLLFGGNCMNVLDLTSSLFFFSPLGVTHVRWVRVPKVEMEHRDFLLIHPDSDSSSIY